MQSCGACKLFIIVFCSASTAKWSTEAFHFLMTIMHRKHQPFDLHKAECHHYHAAWSGPHHLVAMSAIPPVQTTGFVLQFPVDNTLGAWLIGTFSSVLWVFTVSERNLAPLILEDSLTGTTYLQSYQYWRSFPKDSNLLKLWVRTLIIYHCLVLISLN